MYYLISGGVALYVLLDQWPEDKISRWHIAWVVPVIFAAYILITVFLQSLTFIQ